MAMDGASGRTGYMSRQQQQLLMTWDRQFPVTAWEEERNCRIAAIMGHGNPFVTGERQWSFGYRNTGEEIVNLMQEAHPAKQQ